MSRKIIDHFVITKAGRPCGLGLETINSAGLLIPSENVKSVKAQRDASGKRRSDKARAECEKLIRRTLKAIHDLHGTLLDGWAKVDPLLEPGSYTVVPIKAEKGVAK